MDNRQIIQNSIDYIEKNIRTDITADELAERAGYSTFYFYRLFQGAVGMSVMQYILHRRLLNAIFDIGHGMKMTDAALEYGFSSYSSFYKAFKREIGYTPSEFLKRFKVEKPVKAELFKGENIMITHKKLYDILENWEMSDKSIKDVYRENTGIRNANTFCVGEHFVLKASRNLGRIKKQIELSSVMERSRLYTAIVIPTKYAENYVESGGLYFYLTKRLEGKTVKSTDFYGAGGIEKAVRTGECIAELHLALGKSEAAVDSVNMFENLVNWALPKAQKLINIPKNILIALNEKFGSVYHSLPQQIIHRDPNPGNIIVCGDRYGFVDFELSEKNIRIFDPCYAATAVLSETVGRSDVFTFERWVDVYKHIILGYNNVIILTEQEVQALPYVVLANQLLCIAYFSENTKYHDVLEANIKMTKLIFDNFESLNLQ